jgi:general secretion pathway protein C
VEATIKLLHNTRFISIAQRLTLLLVTVWLVWNLAAITWLVAPDIQAESATANNSSLNLHQNKTTVIKYNIRAISELDLFGQPNQINNATKQSELANINAPETSLNLKLMGLRRGSGAIKSSAIVEGPDKQQNIYYIGDQLPSGNAIVEEIFIQHMIISRQGKYETLTLFAVLNGKQGIDETKTSSSATVIDLTTSGFITGKLNKYKDVALKEPMALNGMINVQPELNGEQFMGYKLSPGVDAVFFRKAGLQRGDVVTAINGVKLDSPNKVLSLLGSLAQASDLELTIDRDGESLSFLYSFK